MERILSNFEQTIRLPTGQSLHIRAIRPGDREALVRGFHSLSPASVRDRFFTVKHDLTDAELDYFTRVDFVSHVGLVAELENEGVARPVAVGRFVQMEELPGHAELAITVSDEFQGLGIGSALLLALIECARRLELSHLDATVFAENNRVSRLFRSSGLPLQTCVNEGMRNLSLVLQSGARDRPGT